MLQNYLVQKMKFKKQTAILLGFLSINLIGCSSIEGRPKDAPNIVAVQKLDLERYIGKWYEIARYPNSFEKNCINVTAEYSKRTDGKIAVKNTCFDANNPSKKRVANGYAEQISGKSSIFAVNFAPFPLPKGDGNYHILWIAEDYSKAIIGEPKGKYLWFLARQKTLNKEDFEAMKNIAKAQFYNLDYLEIVKQQ